MTFPRSMILLMSLTLTAGARAPEDNRHAPLASVQQSVVSANQALAQKCRRGVPPGTSVLVHRNIMSLCIAPAAYQGLDPDFIISNQLDGIHFSYKLLLKMEGFEPDEARENLAGMKGCAAQIHSFWNRYGIQFDLAVENLAGSAASPQATEPHQIVRVVNSACRPDDKKICMAGRYPDAPRCEDGCHYELTRPACLAGCNAARWNRVCLLMLHETGHHLGLPDEYADSVCVDRPFVSQDENPWSVMDNQQHGWDLIEFFPRHLKTILQDLCPATDCH